MPEVHVPEVSVHVYFFVFISNLRTCVCVRKKAHVFFFFIMDLLALRAHVPEVNVHLCVCRGMSAYIHVLPDVHVAEGAHNTCMIWHIHIHAYGAVLF